ncbi:MAG: TonB-dependent receptor, partial [Steroidobacteraceae bacterium]|nr:TonB-dependent receptor [Steroidobacteraceae bacterium]
EQCLFLLWGAGRNGKSTFFEILRRLAGDYGVQADFDTFLDKGLGSSGGPRNDLARLHGARVVTTSEAAEGRRLNESLVKSLTGGDTIAARFLYKEAFEFRPTEQWTIGGELRRDREDRERTNTVVGPSSRQAAEFEYTTWRAHADFALTPTQQFYASAAKGVISGYFNGVVDNAAAGLPVPLELQAYDPAENITYELGWKAAWLDRRLTTDIAAFFIDYTGIQLPFVPPPPLVTNLVQNVGGATAQGIELSVNFAATDRFQVGGTFSYTPTEFDDGTVDGGRVAECGGTATAGIPVAARGFCRNLIVNGRALPDVSGNALPRSPNSLASLYGSYEMPLGATDWRFSIRGDASYTSATPATTLDISTIPSRTLFNARIGLRKGPLDIALWSRNLTDENYVSAVIFQPPLTPPPSLGFLPNVSLGERRTFGLTATYSFGP